MILNRTYIYKHHSGAGISLCIYLCDTQSKEKIVIIPLTNEQTPGSIPLSSVNKFADIVNFQEVHKKELGPPLYLKSRPTKISHDEFSAISTSVISLMLKNFETDAAKFSEQLQPFQDTYQFLKWKQKKYILNSTPYSHKITVYENGIYWVSLGVNIGSELNKNRPALIWKKREGGTNKAAYSYIIIPITSSAKAGKYYMNVPIMIRDRQCYLRVEDMKRVNVRRISRPILDDRKNIMFIDLAKREEIKAAIKNFYLFDNQYNING